MPVLVMGHKGEGLTLVYLLVGASYVKVGDIYHLDSVWFIHGI